MIVLKYAVLILFLPAIIPFWLMHRIFGDDFLRYLESGLTPSHATVEADDEFPYIEDRRVEDDPIRWDERHHLCNVDGTPMLDDYVDMNGNAYGCTNIHEI
jgi:hypothetical protein